MLIREDLEKREFEILSDYAMKSAESRGRRFPEEKCAIRTEYQRDRDRIIHSKAFRRLMHKTQVFLAPEGDHFRTRLTHTIEVSQIARTIARSLNLNEDLTEAIALGHDLGHTPFGHNGEAVLNGIHPGGFEHNLQSLRVVEDVYKRQVYCTSFSGEEDGTVPLRDALVLARAEKLIGDNYEYDFTQCLDYPIEEYIMSFGDLAMAAAQEAELAGLEDESTDFDRL